MGEYASVVVYLGAEASPKKLIEAAVAVVEEGAPPPLELMLAWDCHRWETLPDAGGLLDQDYRLLMLMKVASNIHDTVTRLRSLVGDQIHSLSDNERRIIKWLRDEKWLT